MEAGSISCGDRQQREPFPGAGTGCVCPLPSRGINIAKRKWDKKSFPPKRDLRGWLSRFFCFGGLRFGGWVQAGFPVSVFPSGAGAQGAVIARDRRERGDPGGRGWKASPRSWSLFPDGSEPSTAKLRHRAKMAVPYPSTEAFTLPQKNHCEILRRLTLLRMTD